jgi:putative ABC transport system permease protein
VDRSDVRVDFATERPESAVLEIEKMESVRRAEGILQAGGELSNGWRKKWVVIMGLPRNSRLYHVYDTEERRIHMPRDGLLVPERVARQVALSRGASPVLDPYVRDTEDLRVAVRGTAEQYQGVELYADRHYLARALGEGDIVTGALATVDRPRIQQVMDRLDDLPGVMAVTSARTMLEGIQQEVADMMNIAAVIQTIAAGVIAFAVIYNAASVSISEQERDLACLRSLGYEPADVADIATNDIMPLGLVGIALGLPLAYLACLGIADAYETDLYKLPVIVSAVTYGRAVIQAMVFLVVARWISRRRVRRIDIVRRLKTRE